MFHSFLLLALACVSPCASSPSPEYEWRGVWVASVDNIDWPSTAGLSVADQKLELIAILDAHQASGLNAVVWQIRPSCDALYNSPLEPWSEWMTGTQGQAPDPLYDPLQLLLEEGHKRNMEVHAWMNPFRAVVNAETSSIAPQHISVTHPEWTIRYGNVVVLDPGLPDVRQYINEIVLDVITRYEVDGIHWDDYFYPYPIANVSFPDDASFARFGGGFDNRGDWRRDNVNQLVAAVYATIRAHNGRTQRASVESRRTPVKFGISPFGIWKDGVPAGTTGLSSYDAIYCDPVAWLKAETVDYLSPQLYWPIGGGQDYIKLMQWWQEQATTLASTRDNTRHVYPGLAAYRLSSGSSDWDLSVVLDQITASRATAPAASAIGNIFFSSKSVTDNFKGIQDAFRSEVYASPALPPVMPWLQTMN